MPYEKNTCLDAVDNRLGNPEFIARHRSVFTAFTRRRVLTFRVLFILMVSNSLKSLQLRLNELVPKLTVGVMSVSNMAYCKARLKFKHTALTELNQAAVVDVMYSDGDYDTFKGFRLLAGDGSKVRLPEYDDEVTETFGTMAYANGRPGVAGVHAMALASVIYDVLNRVVLSAALLPVGTYEVSAASGQLDTLRMQGNLTATDLVTLDRGYDSYRMMAAIHATGAQFLIRCKRGSGMAVANDMLAGLGPDEQITVVSLPRHLAKRKEYQGLPEKLTVRFVRIILNNGTVEVLATSVVDNTILSTDDLREIYHLRWEIETFYGILKTRLSLENFSGYSVEAIRQDFFATVFLSGMESIFIRDAEDDLARQTGGQPKKVNKAVSFNAIKYRAFELFFSKQSRAQVLQELDVLFATSPTKVRKDRNPPRKRHPDNKVLDWYKRKRKIVF